MPQEIFGYASGGDCEGGGEFSYQYYSILALMTVSLQ